MYMYMNMYMYIYIYHIHIHIHIWGDSEKWECGHGGTWGRWVEHGDTGVGMGTHRVGYGTESGTWRYSGETWGHRVGYEVEDRALHIKSIG